MYNPVYLPRVTRPRKKEFNKEILIHFSSPFYDPSSEEESEEDIAEEVEIEDLLSHDIWKGKFIIVFMFEV